MADHERFGSKPEALMRRVFLWAQRAHVAWFDPVPYASADMNRAHTSLPASMVIIFLTVAIAGILCAYLIANG